MKSTTLLVTLASLAGPGLAAADTPAPWEHEGPAPASAVEQTLNYTMPPPLPGPAQGAGDAYPSFPYRPWRRGERGRYEPSTLAVYHVPAAPPNNCGPSLFEVMNPEPGDAPCVALQRRRWWGR